jgi:hypothetical protein
MAETTIDNERASKDLGIDHEAKRGWTSDPEEVAMEEVGEMDAIAIPDHLITNKWQRLASKFELKSGAEARGIERVNSSMRCGNTTFRDYLDMAIIWFSVNLTIHS